MMFNKMLVATDLTEASDRFICTLGSLQAIGTREVLLVHCFNVRDVGALSESLMDLAAPILDRQKKALEEQGFQVATKLVLGLPQIEIHRLAAESECTFIVVGSQGQSTLGQRLLGGVASTIIQSATKPVLIMRVTWQEVEGRITVGKCVCNPVGHVIFPTDFSENAEHAFSYVEKTVASGASRVTLVHIQDKSRIEKHLDSRLEEFNRIDRDRLDRLRTRLKEISDVDVEVEVPYGNPAEEILRIADERGPDALMVMGNQGRGFWAEVFLGSVSHRVAHRASVPVLLVPALR